MSATESRSLLAAATPAVFIDRRWLAASIGGGGEALAGTAAMLKRLRDAGFRIVVASNESRVAAGSMDEASVQADDRDLAARLALASGTAIVDRFYWCPFDPEATEPNYRRDHAWRKPRPGMLLQAAADLELALDRSWVIAGDEDDLAAARAAGCRIAAIGRLADPTGGVPSEGLAANDLSDAAQAILSQASAPPSAAPAAIAVERSAKPPRLVEIDTPPAGRPSMPTRPAPRPSETPAASPMPRGAPPAEAARDGASPRRSGETDAALAGTMRELAEELRLHRQAARDLTGGRVIAIVLQAGVLLAAAMGLLQLADPSHFLRWFLGAILLQLTAIALLLFDRR